MSFPGGPLNLERPWTPIFAYKWNAIEAWYGFLTALSRIENHLKGKMAYGSQVNSLGCSLLLGLSSAILQYLLNI